MPREFKQGMDVEVRTVTTRSRLAQKTWVEFLPAVDPSAVAEAQTRHRDGRSPSPSRLETFLAVCPRQRPAKRLVIPDLFRRAGNVLQSPPAAQPNGPPASVPTTWGDQRGITVPTGDAAR
ncbi:hypothetical protein CKAH01_16021 [Colletotrichum kahawae]|uniref:Uncharacterized protein n=1 Tax=Colletotrichum kahawae TaxID=34407 RepID=A0AAE0D7C4_COLKA|nr:hypothetical protein CKAH01_16021 [Colletotrichum kahawae]